MRKKRILPPPSLRRRPQYGGLPVPYAGAVEPGTGRPLFGFNNERLRREAILERRCGQCGEKLGKVFAFIGDEEACKKAAFKEAAMCMSCARYILQVCPYFTKDQHNPGREPRLEHVVVLKYGDEKLPPAEKWGVYLTRDYQAVATSWGQVLIRAGEQVGVTLWYSHGRELVNG